jgi:hypothetical protein
MSNAYRNRAPDYPGRYAAGQRASTPGGTEGEAVSRAVADVLASYHLYGDDVIRARRAVLHDLVPRRPVVSGFLSTPTAASIVSSRASKRPRSAGRSYRPER